LIENASSELGVLSINNQNSRINNDSTIKDQAINNRHRPHRS